MPKRTKGAGPRGAILDDNGEVARTRKDMVRLARQLRKEMTREEQLLWDRLRGKKLRSLRFYRQVPIDRYVVDFYCPRHKLIIELDGAVHQARDQMEHDCLRSMSFESKGFMILRIPNEDVYSDLHGVVCRILNSCGF